MKTPILNEQELKEFGFKEQEKGQLDNGDFYAWYSYRKNYSEITITYEYEANRKFISGYVEFNSEVLKGRPVTKKDLQFLKEIM